MNTLHEWNGQIEGWPRREAEKVVKKYRKKEGDKIVLQAGFGPSGFPHIGTIRDVATAHFVRLALASMGYDTELSVFSDNTDSFNRIPGDVKRAISKNHAEYLKSQRGKPLFTIENPTDTKLINGTVVKPNSYSKFMAVRLEELLNKLEIPHKLKYASREYNAHRFDTHIVRAMEMAETIDNIFEYHFGKKQLGRQWKFPYFPVCDGCGKVASTRVLEIDPDKYLVKYACDIDIPSRGITSCKTHKKKHIREGSYLGNNGKLPFALQWLARWIDWDTETEQFVPTVHYEPHGKDLLSLKKLAGIILREVYDVKTVPEGLTYGMILDEEGKKFSKSQGNDFGVNNMLDFSTNDALLQFLMKDPKKDRILSVGLVPQINDEARAAQDQWHQIDPKTGKRKSDVYWFTHNGKPPENPVKFIGYNQLLSLISCVGPYPEVIEPYLQKVISYSLEKFHKQKVVEEAKQRRGQVQLGLPFQDEKAMLHATLPVIERIKSGTKDALRYYKEIVLPKAIAYYEQIIAPSLKEPLFSTKERNFVRRVYDFIKDNEQFDRLDLETMSEADHKAYYTHMNETIVRFAMEEGLGKDVPKDLTNGERRMFEKVHGTRMKAYRTLYRALLNQDEGAPFSTMLLLTGRYKIMNALQEYVDAPTVEERVPEVMDTSEESLAQKVEEGSTVDFATAMYEASRARLKNDKQFIDWIYSKDSNSPEDVKTIIEDRTKYQAQERGEFSKEIGYLRAIEALTYIKYAELAEKLDGDKPTAEDLIAQQIDACQLVHDVAPHLGNFGRDMNFEKWLNAVRAEFTLHRDTYAAGALETYNIIAQHKK